MIRMRRAGLALQWLSGASRPAAARIAAHADCCIPWQNKRTRLRARLFAYEETGANLVETALVLPVYFLVIFVFMSFSIVLFAYCNASYASRIAVRYAVVHSATSATPCTTSAIQSIVLPYLWGAPSGGVGIVPQWTPSNSVGSVVSVKVTLTYSTGMPYGYLNNMVATASAQGVIVH